MGSGGGANPIDAFTLTNSGGTNSQNFTTASITPTGNRLVLAAVLSYEADSTTPDTPTMSGNGLTWVEIDNILFDDAGADRGRLTLFRGMVASPSSGTATISHSKTHSGCLWSIVEFDDVDTSGTHGSGAIVQSAQAPPTPPSSATSLNVTLSAFGDTDNATYGAFGHMQGTEHSITSPPTNGFTLITEQDGGSTAKLGTEWRDDNDTGVDMTWDTADNNGGIAVEIKAAASGGGDGGSSVYIAFNNSADDDLQGMVRAGGNDEKVDPTTTITNDEWWFAALTYSDTNNRLRLWLGRPQEALSSTEAAVAGSATLNWDTTSADVWALGRQLGGTPDKEFTGDIAHFASWDVELSGDELESYRFGGMPQRDQLLQHLPCWGIDSPEPDLSGNGLNGTVNGAIEADHAPVGPYNILPDGWGDARLSSPMLVGTTPVASPAQVLTQGFIDVPGVSQAPSATIPGVSVLLSQSDPTESPQVFDNVTAHVRQFATSRGRDTWHARFSAGTAEIVFDNRSRQMDPTYDSGPYSPLRIMRQIRIQATWDDVVYDLFRGYVDSYELRYPGQVDAITIVRCTDAFKVLNLHDLALIGNVEKSGTRIAAVLADAGITDTLIDAGQADLAAETVTGSALSHVQQVAESEGSGAGFFISAGGTATFQDRHHRILQGSTVQGTLSDDTDAIRYRDVTLDVDEADLWNEIEIQIPSGESASATNATSQTRYFERKLSRTFLLDRVAEAESAAEFLVNRLAEPEARLSELDIVGARNTSLWSTVLGGDLSERFLFERNPPGGGTISQEGYLERIRHSATPGADWRTTWLLSPVEAEGAVFIWGRSRWGIDTRWGY